MDIETLTRASAPPAAPGTSRRWTVRDAAASVRYRMSTASHRTIVGIVIGSAIVGSALANQSGWWWVTPLSGTAIGLVTRRRWMVLGCVAVGAVAWGGDLAIQAAGGGIGTVARVTGALAGLGPNAGSTVLAVAVGYGIVLCLAGGWLAATARSAVRTYDPGGRWAKAIVSRITTIGGWK